MQQQRRKLAARKAPQPVILRVLVRDAYANGMRFYEGNGKVWLADRVPVEFIAFDG